MVTWEDGSGQYWVPEQPVEQWEGWNGQLEVPCTHRHRYYAKLLTLGQKSKQKEIKKLSMAEHLRH